jgi:putative ATP-dependent endonuclease of OLD family
MPIATLRKFLASVSTRPDYPTAHPYNPAISDDDVSDLAFKVLKGRKGEAYAYAAVLIEHCEAEADLPVDLVGVLATIDEELRAEPEEPVVPGMAPESPEEE